MVGIKGTRHPFVCVTALVALLFTGCSGGVEERPQCSSGENAACQCADGSAGTQTCTAEGTFGACLCPDEPPTECESVEAFPDSDGDGYGVTRASHSFCNVPVGFSVVGGDCDDDDSGAYPGAEERCDRVDNNCDGAIDESSSLDTTAVFLDDDGDGFGDPSTSMTVCWPEEALPEQHLVENDWDCDDQNDAIHPDALEVCDEVDNDCDQLTDDEDDSLSDPPLWYFDFDGDGSGVATDTIAACLQPSDYVGEAGDCNDDDDRIFTGAPEWCDDLDRNCDNDPHDGAVDAQVYYTDTDGDGRGDTVTEAFCEEPEDVSESVEGCIDGAEEQRWYPDLDFDGYGVESGSQLACERPGDDWALLVVDCEPELSDSYPFAPELCDGRDNNCNDVVDEGCPVFHCGDITESETWEVVPAGHVVTCDIFVGGASDPVLTIAPGVEVRFEPDTGIFTGVLDDGSMVVSAVETNVLFTSAEEEPEPGDWDGLVFGAYDQGSRLHGLFQEFGDGIYSEDNAGLDLQESTFRMNDGHGLELSFSSASVVDCTFDNNTGNGVLVGSQSTLSNPFEGNRIIDNSQHPVHLPAHQVERLMSDGVYGPNVIDIVHVSYGPLEGSDVHWWPIYDDDKSAIPYGVYDSDLVLRDPEEGEPAKLTIHGGVHVYFEPYLSFEVGTDYEGGSLEVVGDRDGGNPVVFDVLGAVDDDRWGGIYVSSEAGPIRMDGFEILHGGSHQAGLFFDSAFRDGFSNWVRDCLFDDNLRYGLRAEELDDFLVVEDCFFTATAAVGVTTPPNGIGLMIEDSLSSGDTIGTVQIRRNQFGLNEHYPALLSPNLWGGFEPSNNIAENGTDVVYGLGGNVITSQSWASSGVPFRSDGNIVVRNGAFLEVGGGVESPFVLELGGMYSLIAGTYNPSDLALDHVTIRPIVRGEHWRRVDFSAHVSSRSHVRNSILDGGGWNGNEGMLYLNTWAAPSQPEVTNTEIRNSATCGLKVTPRSAPLISEVSFFGIDDDKHFCSN